MPSGVLSYLPPTGTGAESRSPTEPFGGTGAEAGTPANAAYSSRERRIYGLHALVGGLLALSTLGLYWPLSGSNVVTVLLSLVGILLTMLGLPLGYWR